MAAITTTYEERLSLGNRNAVVAKASAVANTNTFDTGMSKIEHVSITNGASGRTIGYTVSGSVITFACSGALANAMIMAIGL